MAAKFPDNSFVPAKAGVGLRLVVAEAPGEEEAVLGEPLVGGSGKWFDSLARKAGVSRDSLTIINTLNCRPPNNVYPTDPEARSYISPKEAQAAVDQCYHSHVEPLVKGRNWQRIDVLGDKALRRITGKHGGIFKWRGSPCSVLGSELVNVMPTLHPAYIARDQSMIPVVINDLKKSLVVAPENYVLYPSIQDLEAFDATSFAFDIETNMATDQITMVGLCAKPYHALVVPFHGAYISQLRRIFNNASEVIGHNCIQFDLPYLRDSGIHLRSECKVWDTMLLQHLCQPDLPHDLEFVSSLFVAKPAWKDDKSNFELYNARDTDCTLQCALQLRPMVRARGLASLYEAVQVPLARICRLMAETGVKVDTSRIGVVREKLILEMQREEQLLPSSLRTRLDPTRKRVPAPEGTLGKSGKPVKYVFVEATEEVTPWRSTQEVQAYLYVELGLPKQLHSKTEKVTSDKTALDKLYRRTKRREILAISKLRKMDELVTTFCKEQTSHVDRVFPHFNVHGTASGRLSSSDPNLQNIPEPARVIYVPSHKDWKLVEVDYSGIENRLTAHFANDEGRLARFLADPGYSEHKHAVEVFFGIPYDEVEKDNDKDAPYGKAKRITHGVNYGMGAKKISNMYDMDFREVKELLYKWKLEIQPTIQWQERVASEAKSQGWLVTCFGRKRWFYTTSYYTEALSFLPQSTAADVIFRAMIALMHERIGHSLADTLKVVRYVEALPKPARLLLQVHDSLLLECPGTQVDEVIATVRRVMEQPWPELGGMVIPIGIAVGDSWGEMEAYKGGV